MSQLQRSENLARGEARSQVRGVGGGHVRHLVRRQVREARLGMCVFGSC